jgi:peptidoglycan/LPS O-acetylase OafA/YrhL
MANGQQRTMAARGAAALGFLCGLIGLVAGATVHSWKFGAIGWFTGGALLALLAVFALVDGALAAKPR